MGPESRTAWAALLAVAATGAMGVPAAGAETRPVVASAAGEFQPARGGDFLAWERNTRAAPRHYDVFAKRRGGRKFRVNAPNTQAANGGIDGNTLFYQQFRGRRSDIKIFDLAHRRRHAPPRGINTPHWEYWPSVSGRWLLFGRYKRGGNRKLLLANLQTGATRVLAKTTSAEAFLAPGQVNGGWVAYARCTPTTRCDVYRYRIASKNKSKLPNPGFYQRAPSVTPTGTVYLVRSRRRCGRSVRIVRHAIGNPGRAVATLRPGTDIGDTYVYSYGKRPNRLLFDRRRCGHAVRANIYAAEQPRLIAIHVRTEGAGGGGVASKPSGIDCGADCAQSFVAGASITLTARPEANSNFTGWGGVCSGSGRTCTTTARRASRVIAFFDPASSFSLSITKRGTGTGKVTSAPAGIACGGDCWQSYRAGTAVTLSATPAAGSRFSGWTGPCSGTDKCRVTMDRVRSVTATFTRLPQRTESRALYPSYIDARGATPGGPPR